MWEWFKYFFSWQHLFASYAPKFRDSTYQGLMYSLGVMFLVGIVFKIISAWQKVMPWKIVYRRIGAWFITLSILSLLTVFFTQTSTPLLGSRFWFVLWLLTGIVWLVFISRYAFSKLPKQIEEIRQQQERAKYLPKKF